METITANQGNRVISDNTMQDQPGNKNEIDPRSMGVRQNQDAPVEFVDMPCSNLCMNEYHCSASLEVAKKKKMIIQDYQCSSSKPPMCLGYSNNCDTGIQIFKGMKTLSQYTIQCEPNGPNKMANPNTYFIRKQDNTLNDNQLMLAANNSVAAEADKMNQDLIAAGQQEEVLRAAKALFSKKTRTLYHWMYPNTPKFQLKNAVSMAWDTMDINEKQFYISQVLGKFGSLQNRLMINPQLGLLNRQSIKQSTNSTAEYNAVETSTAVANLLAASTGDSSDKVGYDESVVTGSRKRGRPRGHSKSALKLMQHDFVHAQHQQEFELPFQSGESHNIYHNQEMKFEKSFDNNFQHLEFPDSVSNSYEHGYGNENLYRAHIQEDDFTDDPELRNELDKYQWNLNKCN